MITAIMSRQRWEYVCKCGVDGIVAPSSLIKITTAPSSSDHSTEWSNISKRCWRKENVHTSAEWWWAYMYVCVCDYFLFLQIEINERDLLYSYMYTHLPARFARYPTTTIMIMRKAEVKKTPIRRHTSMHTLGIYFHTLSQQIIMLVII